MPHNNIPNMHNTYCCKCRTKVLGPFNSYLRGYRCVSCAATYSHLLLRSFQSIFRYRVFFFNFLPPPPPDLSVCTVDHFTQNLILNQDKIRRRKNAANCEQRNAEETGHKLFTVSLFTCVGPSDTSIEPIKYCLDLFPIVIPSFATIFVYYV